MVAGWRQLVSTSSNSVCTHACARVTTRQAMLESTHAGSAGLIGMLALAPFVFLRHSTCLPVMQSSRVSVDELQYGTTVGYSHGQSTYALPLSGQHRQWTAPWGPSELTGEAVHAGWSSGRQAQWIILVADSGALQQHADRTAARSLTAPAHTAHCDADGFNS